MFEVTQSDPGPRGFEPFAKLPGRSEGLAVPAPPPVPIGHPGQPVGHRVEVRGHVEPVDAQVVTRVDDHGDVLGRHGAGQAAEELPRPHAPGERRDLHVRYLRRSAAVPARRALNPGGMWPKRSPAVSQPVPTPTPPSPPATPSPPVTPAASTPAGDLARLIGSRRPLVLAAEGDEERF